MCKKFRSNPELQEAFKKYVDVLGGEKCNHWSKVADYLRREHNHYVKKPQSLSVIYQTLFIPNQELDSADYKVILSLTIQNRCHHREAYRAFCQQTGKTLTYSYYKTLAVKFVKKGLSTIIKAMATKKKDLCSFAYRMQWTTFKVLLSLIDYQTEDQLMLEIKPFAAKAEKLFYCYSDEIDSERPTVYASLRQITNRREVDKVIEYIRLIDILQEVYKEKLKDDTEFFNHPCLCQSVELVKQLPLYRELIVQHDWSKKYELYKLAAMDQDIDKVKGELLEQKITKKINPEFRIQKPRTSRFGIKRQKLYKDPHTIQFKDELELLEARQPLQLVKERQQALQELYDKAFTYEQLLFQKEKLIEFDDFELSQ